MYDPVCWAKSLCHTGINLDCICWLQNSWWSFTLGWKGADSQCIVSICCVAKEIWNCKG